MNKINQFDRSGNRNGNFKNNKTDKEGQEPKSGTQNFTRNPKYKPCSYCEKAGRPGLYHPEAECRLKLRNQQKLSSQQNNNSTERNIKIANNTVRDNFERRI